jgi:predicted outer membrane repeat protein
MDARLFDTLTRSLGVPGSRRGVLRRLASLPILGSLAAITPLSPDADAARKGRKRRKHRDNAVRAEGPCGDGSARANRCRKHRQCCTGRCRKKKNGRGRCRCLRPGQACTTNQQCCPKRSGATCQDGVCTRGQPCGHDCPPPPPTCDACTATELCIDDACVACDVCADGCPHQTIQDAIDNASDGATIHVCAGTYTRGDNDSVAEIPSGTQVTLRGAGIGQTVLDEEDLGSVVVIGATAQVRIEALTITRGNAEEGGGIFNEGTLTLRDTLVTANTATSVGGGIASKGILTLEEGTRVEANASESFAAGIFNEGGTVTLQAGSQVSGNSAGVSGGGIYNGAGSVTLEAGSQVNLNSAVGGGGGMYNAQGSVTLKNGSQVRGNTTGDTGGGITNVFGGTLTLEPGSQVIRNTTVNAGGGIFNGAASADLQPGAIVCGNEPDDCGGNPITGTCPNPADAAQCPA